MAGVSSPVRAPSPAPWAPAPVSTVRRALEPAALRARLLPAPVAVPRAAWLAPVLVVLLGAVLRFWDLGHPDAIVFDETYYVKDSWSLLLHGYERQWPEGADDAFVAGTPPEPLEGPSYVVHPPVGKWAIAAGMALFGVEDPVGWRFSAAVAGTLSIALVCAAGWLLFRSVAVATLAGLFLAVDGLHLVQSRLALLDVFLMLFVLLAFVALLLDREHGRRRLVARLGTAPGSPLPEEQARRRLSGGPWLGVRWWRIAAGLACGLAVGTKWNGLFLVAGLGVLSVLWDLNARRVAGVRHWLRAGVLKDGLPAFLAVVGTGAVVYTASWAGWFASSGGYSRTWAQEHPGEGIAWLPAPLRSLWAYHASAFEFHQGLGSPHSYEALPWLWLTLGRPTSYYYESPGRGTAGCTVEHCSQAILNIGNPLLWWTGIAALVVAAWLWAVRRDWRFGAPLGIFAAGYLPWFLFPERTMYFFYALPVEPFLVLVLAGVLGLVLGRPGDPVARRRAGVVVVGVFVATVLALSAHFAPLWYGQTIPYAQWRERMWFDAWI
ncbi:phospholipid carrier-dependent glycosyltransferase [Kocuria sp. LUK]|uniref:dolichyl-phosphate-mannose--protein mannosyltransferase n=1 Tax=Kocuria sp. LUK TaxID=2897828 RepID=UPI001E47F3D1|nr:phospholipid carrier-dependent glycosyltransferase [Kocuria sp. LUK]MCD1144884.1 phospholipid carrier-dependent glycosyltransferase [Kocuria sp. LUK]